jgi:hypothetical protein
MSFLGQVLFDGTIICISDFQHWIQISPWQSSAKEPLHSFWIYSFSISACAAYSCCSFLLCLTLAAGQPPFPYSLLVLFLLFGFS